MQRASFLTRTATRGVLTQQRLNSTASYQYILTEVKDNVGIITLNRPKALNALCNALLDEVIDAGRKFDKDDNIGCIIITGSEKAFAAGADIKEMSTLTFAQCYTQNLFKSWTEIPKISKPVSYTFLISIKFLFSYFLLVQTIAAVSGYALGGGCELAMLCDMIIASESAKFGQPEITLGVIPGQI